MDYLRAHSHAWSRARAIATDYGTWAEVRLVDIALLAYALGLGTVLTLDLPLVSTWNCAHLGIQSICLNCPVQRLGLEVCIDWASVHTMDMAISEYNIDHRL